MESYTGKPTAIDRSRPSVRLGGGVIDLLVRLPNWVGDVCKSLPILHALREAGFALHLVVRRPLDDLVLGFGRPVVTVGRGILGPARTLQRVGCSRGLLLSSSFGTAAAARLAGVRAVGFRMEYRSWLLYWTVEYPIDQHQVASLMSLGRTAHETFEPGGSWPDSSPELDLPLTVSHREKAQLALATANIAGSFTMLCPMATGTRRNGRTRVWPYWRELSRRLAGLGHQLVVCPGPGEEQACASAVPEARLIGPVGLGTFAATCTLAEQVVANDSGPLFIAAAVGTPVLGIYGVAVRPRRRPLGADFIGSTDGYGWPTVDEVVVRLGR